MSAFERRQEIRNYVNEEWQAMKYNAYLAEKREAKNAEETAKVKVLVKEKEQPKKTTF